MRTSRRFNNFITFLLALAGLLLLAYPTISDRWNARYTRATITQYEQVLEDTDTSVKDDIVRRCQEYNRNLIGSQVPNSFMEHDHPLDPVYESLLNLDGNGVMGEVEIPCIKVQIPIYHYCDPEVLEMGAGHLQGSSLPVGGEGTHCVISAHRGLPNKMLFTDLDRVKVGNIFFLDVMEEKLAYEVDQILVVEPQDTDDLAIEPGKDQCTLLTCTPYAVNTHRLLVRGHRIPFTEETYHEEAQKVAPPKAESVLMRVLCVVLGLLLAALILGVRGWFIRRRHRKRRALREAQKNAKTSETTARKTEEVKEERDEQ